MSSGSAVFSACQLYRYRLERWSDPFKTRVVARSDWCTFLMLNPSTADASMDDPTIRRCRGFGEALGVDRFAVVNLFAFRATNPQDLREAQDPVGPENDSAIRWVLDSPMPVIVGWGSLPYEWLRRLARPRVERIVAMAEERCKPLLCLGTCTNGQPRHPLFVPGGAEVVFWNPKIP